MLQTYGLIIIMCCYFAVFLGFDFIYSDDKHSQSGAQNYLKLKGGLYAGMACVSIILDLILKWNTSLTLVFSICIAILEAVQIFAQLTAEKRKARINASLSHSKGLSDYKKIEILYTFCLEEIDFIKENNESLDAKILAYEEIHDYLKYYACSKMFLNTFQDYIQGRAELNDLYQMLDAWKSDFELYCIRIVKIPDAD